MQNVKSADRHMSGNLLGDESDEDLGLESAKRMLDVNAFNDNFVS